MSPYFDIVDGKWRIRLENGDVCDSKFTTQEDAYSAIDLAFDHSMMHCDDVLAEILREIRTACPAWADVDVDTRNDLISKWRKILQRKRVAVERNPAVEEIRAKAARWTQAELDELPEDHVLLQRITLLSAYDTLAQDLARANSAHDVHMAEITAAKEKITELTIANEAMHGTLGAQVESLTAEIAGLRERLGREQSRWHSLPSVEEPT